MKLIKAPWFTRPNECDICKKYLESILEKMHMSILGKDIKLSEEEEKNLKYIRDLVTIIYKYKDIKDENCSHEL